MVKRKYIAVAVLFCCWASLARGQCTGYAITGTSVNILSPSKAAAQGTASATVWLQNGLSNSQNSHKATETQSTWVGYGWKGNCPPGHICSTSTYFTVDADTMHQQEHGTTLSGTDYHAWTTGTNDIGHTYHQYFVITDQTAGTTSKDVDDITVTSGTNNTIVSQDGIGTNAYYQLVSTFGGGSMMNNCSECQGGEIQKCLQATHTPLFDSTITNPRTSETYTISNASAGNVATAQESVSGTAYTPLISVLPGDSPTGSTTNKIYCSMFGWILAQQWNPGLPENEFAITALETIPSTCKLTLRFFETGDSWGVQCQVAWKKPPATADRCSVASQIPDFNPATVWDEQDCKVPGNCNTSDLPPPNGTNTNFPKYWYGASWGIRFGGPPAPGQPDPIINGGAHNWVFPIYLADAYIPGGPDEQWWILDLLNIAVAKGTGLPIDCTNRDKGTSPIQSPW